MKAALQEGYGVSENDVTSSFVGPTWGADVTRQAFWGLVAFVVLALIGMAFYFRTWKMAAAACSPCATTSSSPWASTPCPDSRSPRPRSSVC